MSVLGIDASLNGTGLCVASTAMPHQRYMTMVVTLKSGGDRIVKWANILDRLIPMAKKVDVVMIEDYAYGAHSSSTAILAELGGVIRWELWKIRARLLVVGTSQLKKFATGKGVAPKNVMLKEVYRRWNQDFSDDNAADAFVLAKIGEAILGEQQEPLTKVQVEVISKIMKDLQPIKPTTVIDGWE